MNITGIITIVALGAVAIILGMGLWNMFRGGDHNLSQKLMRARAVSYTHLTLPTSDPLWLSVVVIAFTIHIAPNPSTYAS
ncbi:twin transmembrane helix small protein, partial [Devosia insulae]|uniref:twin transmembrane helix small protein n=1 Tax=Devosia insulae TaxID=408174 RepID=UPI00114CC785